MNKIRAAAHRPWTAVVIFFVILLSVAGVTAWPGRAAEDPLNRPGLYWTDLSADIIYRANLDGSQIEEVLTVPGLGEQQPAAVIIDRATGELIFWADAPGSWEKHLIWRAGMNGFDVRLAFLDLHNYMFPGDGSMALALDSRNHDLYWGSEQPYYYGAGDLDSGSIFRGNLDDGQLGVRFMPGPMDPFSFPEEQPDLELDQEANMFYWSDADGIRRAPLDGIETEFVLQNYAWPMSALENTPFALDREAGTIYYLSSGEFSNQMLTRTDIGAPWNVEELVPEDNGQVLDIAVDTVNDKLYWSVRGRETAIRRSSLDGTSVETIVDDVQGPLGLALDTAAGKLYWADWDARKIQRANLDGSSLEDLTDTAPVRPRYLALDGAQGLIYWSGQGDGRVWQSPMNGGGFNLLVAGTSGKTGGIDYHAATDTLFWLDTAGNTVTKAFSDGTGVVDVLYPRTGHVGGLFLEAEMEKIVWFDQGHQAIRRANMDGSGVETVLSGGFDLATSLAWDPMRQRMCWTDPFMRHIECAGWNGEGRRTILSQEDGLRRPNVLAIDARAGHIYWTDWTTHSLHRANVDGSDMVVIIPDLIAQPSGLALNLEPPEVRRAYMPLVLVGST